MQEKIELKIELKGGGQQNSACCWYACYRMLYKWGNKTKLDLDRNLVSAGYNLSEVTNRGLQDNEYMKVARAVRTKEVLYKSVLNWSYEDVVHRLKIWGPILFFAKEFTQYVEEHAILIYGADPQMNAILYADPYNLVELSDADAGRFSLKRFKETLQPVPYSLQVL